MAATPPRKPQILSIPVTFWTIKKKQTFSPGGFAPRTPPFKPAAVADSASQVRTLEPSRPLSRPPWVGSTWSMVWNVDYRTARSSPTRPADSGTFFWAPFRNFFLQVVHRISKKFKSPGSTGMSFLASPGMISLGLSRHIL